MFARWKTIQVMPVPDRGGRWVWADWAGWGPGSYRYKIFAWLHALIGQ